MNNRPILLMIAGPNGSGKTTLTRKLQAQGLDFGHYINPDDIAASLSGPYAERVAEAQKQADRLRAEYLKRKESFSFETVMSHPSKIDVLREARTLGFQNFLYFVATDSPRLNAERVAQRVTLGGHDVPTDRIVQRYHRSLALLPSAIKECDRVVLFDNSYRDTERDYARFSPFLEIVRKDSHFELQPTGSHVPEWSQPVLTWLWKERTKRRKAKR